MQKTKTGRLVADALLYGTLLLLFVHAAYFLRITINTERMSEEMIKQKNVYIELPCEDKMPKQEPIKGSIEWELLEHAKEKLKELEK